MEPRAARRRKERLHCRGRRRREKRNYLSALLKIVARCYAQGELVQLCKPHLDRTGKRIPAVKIVNDEPMCKRCFLGRSIFPAEERLVLSTLAPLSKDAPEIRSTGR